jgi:hypothetical protein
MTARSGATVWVTLKRRGDDLFRGAGRQGEKEDDEERLQGVPSGFDRGEASSTVQSKPSVT